jgi:transcriptional regulator with PAS, ATPase and Fis domain
MPPIPEALSIDWLGPAPARSLASALVAQGVRVRRGRGGGDGPCIVASGARHPRPPAGRPWIWVPAGAVSDATATEAVLDGAYDVVPAGTADAAERIAARTRELATMEHEPARPPELVARSAAAQRVLGQVARAARTAMAVLLTGETGTGKEMLARLIHQWSPRRERAFVPINCAAIPNELMEAELFGYARGAFSGAVQAYEGQLAAAAGGTVFLDEIHDTPPALQVKLLRVLEDRVVSRLGENTWRRIDFRIVAATNRDLGPLIESGVFGADLYERLAIVTIELPPLRERLEDLPGLVDQFIERFHAGDGAGISRVRGIRPDALRALAAYRWPGNVRELRNVVWETLVYKRAGDEIIPADLPHRVLRPGTTAATAGLVDRGALARRIAARALDLKGEIAALERTALTEALALAGGNAAEAARLLGTVGRGHARDPGGTVRAMLRRLRRSTASR